MRRLLGFTAPLLLALMAATPSAALARDGGRGHDGDRHGNYERGRDHGRRDWDRDRRDARRDWDRDRRRYDGYRDRDRRYYGYRDHDRRYYAPPVRVIRRDYGPPYGHAYGYRGYGPPRWARGTRYYDRGYGPTYVVYDYGRYGLRQPPYGYRWRRSDAGDFLLVAVATGIIADLILHN
ncbi:RcnB family protein [Luteimonas aquatica]|uniref:RcnB family protein n=1 Tax=Luteimonas aquatica TaxID=450364 RepID=UPI001F5ABE40|nr:RcnB family protein [Luteimonas aquatica]